MSHLSWNKLCRGAAVALLLSSAGEAQEVSGERPLEEVVVTAMRTETNLQKTAVAVTAISSEALKERNITSLLDIESYVPSLSIGSRSGTGTAGGGVSIRGMGVDAEASSAAVGTYIDDVFFASWRGNLLGLLDVDRVEVLRGPQGTLFGRNTIAGAIQYVTRKPEKELGGYLTGIFGNFNRLDVQGAFNLPLGDTFALRFAGMYNERDGYVRDVLNGVDAGADRTKAGRVRAEWTPTDRLTVDVKGEALEEHTNGRAVLVAEVNPNAQFVGLAQLFGETRPLDNSYLSSNQSSFSGFNAPDYFDFDYYTAQGIIDYRLSDSINLKSISAYSSYRSRLAQDLDNSPLSILEIVPAHDDTDVFTQELQLTGKALADRLGFTLGGYYYDSQQRWEPGRQLIFGFGPTIPEKGGPPAWDIRSWAAYGNFTYNLTDRLSMIVGIRYTDETNKAWLIGITPPTESTFTDTSPHVGLNFQLNDDVLFYVKASKGFRAGGTTPDANLPGGGLAFDPETAWTYEAGARMEFLDRRLRVNPTIFLTDWKDIQFNVLIPLPTTVVAATNNAGDARIKGFELEALFAATDHLQLSGSMSLLDGNYTRVEPLIRFEFPLGFPGPAVVLPNLTLDTPLQRLPKTKFTVGARYSYPLAAGSKLLANLDYAWTDNQSSSVTISDNVEMPSYGVLNARLQYESPGGRWSVAAFGTNLTDEFYLVGGADFAGGYTVGNKELDPARPREYGLEVQVRF
jgi:iron complex outermembrane receptor protein